MRKIIRAALGAMVLAGAFASAGGAPQSGPRTIEDYFRLLPERYVTHVGDYGRVEKIVDVKNGYLAFADTSAGAARPVFEFALYRAADGTPFFIAANTQYDHACHSFETFFLTHDGKGWGDAAAAGVMPRLTPDTFFKERGPAALVGKHEGWRSYLRHRPARRGPTLEVSLELCDVAIENDPNLGEGERRTLAALLARRPRAATLRWNRLEGKFEFARGN